MEIEIRKSVFSFQLWHLFPAVAVVEPLRLSWVRPFPAIALAPEEVPDLSLPCFRIVSTIDLIEQLLLCDKRQQNRVKPVRSAVALIWLEILIWKICSPPWTRLLQANISLRKVLLQWGWVVLRSLLFRVKMSGNTSTFRCSGSGLQGVYKYHGKNQRYPGHWNFSFVLITLSSTEITIYHHQKTACWFAFLFLFFPCFTFVCSEMHIFFADCGIWLSKVRVSGILWVPDIFWDRREAVCLVLIKHSFFLTCKTILLWHLLYWFRNNVTKVISKLLLLQTLFSQILCQHSTRTFLFCFHVYIHFLKVVNSSFLLLLAACILFQSFPISTLLFSCPALIFKQERVTRAAFHCLSYKLYSPSNPFGKISLPFFLRSYFWTFLKLNVSVLIVTDTLIACLKGFSNYSFTLKWHHRKSEHSSCPMLVDFRG